MATVTVGGGGRTPKTYELNKASFTVGREASCDIHIDNVAVSKKHCEFLNREGKFFVKDLGSSNGTYIGTEKITEHALKDGEEIVIGSYSLRFENQAERHGASEVAAPTDGGDMMTLQLSPEMMRKKLEELKQEKEKSASAGPEKVMTAKEYGAQFSPPSGQPEASPASTKMGVVVFVVLMIVVWAVAIAIKMGGSK
jgi:pSer/pThr/pTyr-binding forkhead associated (FHA) protein